MLVGTYVYGILRSFVPGSEQTLLHIKINFHFHYQLSNPWHGIRAASAPSSTITCHVSTPHNQVHSRLPYAMDDDSMRLVFGPIPSIVQHLY